MFNGNAGTTLGTEAALFFTGARPVSDSDDNEEDSVDIAAETDDVGLLDPRLTPREDEDPTCVICHDALSEAYRTTCCRHLACLRCIHGYLNAKLPDADDEHTVPCFVCRTPLTAKCLLRDQRAEEHSAQQVRQCHFDGCDFEGIAADLAEHRKVCPKKPESVTIAELRAELEDVRRQYTLIASALTTPIAVAPGGGFEFHIFVGPWGYTSLHPRPPATFAQVIYYDGVDVRLELTPDARVEYVDVTVTRITEAGHDIQLPLSILGRSYIFGWRRIPDQLVVVDVPSIPHVPVTFPGCWRLGELQWHYAVEKHVSLTVLGYSRPIR